MSTVKTPTSSKAPPSSTRWLDRVGAGEQTLLRPHSRERRVSGGPAPGDPAPRVPDQVRGSSGVPSAVQGASPPSGRRTGCVPATNVVRRPAETCVVTTSGQDTSSVSEYLDARARLRLVEWDYVSPVERARQFWVCLSQGRSADLAEVTGIGTFREAWCREPGSVSGDDSVTVRAGRGPYPAGADRMPRRV